jgi:hypothetical protein
LRAVAVAVRAADDGGGYYYCVTAVRICEDMRLKRLRLPCRSSSWRKGVVIVMLGCISRVPSCSPHHHQSLLPRAHWWLCLRLASHLANRNATTSVVKRTRGSPVPCQTAPLGFTVASQPVSQPAFVRQHRADSIITCQVLSLCDS